LNTGTQLNADVQSTRTGSPKLAFRCYSEADGLPLKKVQLHTPRLSETKGDDKKRVSPSEVTLRAHVKDENGNYLKQSFEIYMNGHHLLAISDGHKEGKIKVPILPDEPDYGLGSFSIDDRRYHVNTTINKDGREDNVFDIILTLTPKEVALNIKVLQPDGKASIEGIRVELKGNKIQKFTNPEGTAQFIVKASSFPVTIVIHPTDIYQG